VEVLGVGVQRSTEPSFVLLPLGPPRRRGGSPRQNKVVKFHLTRQAAASTGCHYPTGVSLAPRATDLKDLPFLQPVAERQAPLTTAPPISATRTSLQFRCPPTFSTYFSPLSRSPHSTARAGDLPFERKRSSAHPALVFGFQLAGLRQSHIWCKVHCERKPTGL